MNTGTAIETDRLFLLPGQNDRDSAPFLHMLREDGNFKEFCGLDFLEKYLAGFASYFENTGHEECIYSIFQKTDSNKFIGYVGFHREYNGDYELEFYISKDFRRLGYCKEACNAVINQVFNAGISVDENPLTVSKLYATTLADNKNTIGLLTKLGFKENIPKDGPVLVMQGFVDKEDDTFFGNMVVKMVKEKEENI